MHRFLGAARCLDLEGHDAHGGGTRPGVRGREVGQAEALQGGGVLDVLRVALEDVRDGSRQGTPASPSLAGGESQ